MNGEDLKRLVADFNRDWLDITRTRELLVLAEEFSVRREDATDRETKVTLHLIRDGTALKSSCPALCRASTS